MKDFYQNLDIMLLKYECSERISDSLKVLKSCFFFMIWKNVWVESVITGQNEMRSIRENTSRLRKPLWVLNIPLRWKVNSWWLNGEEQFQGRAI